MAALDGQREFRSPADAEAKFANVAPVIRRTLHSRHLRSRRHSRCRTGAAAAAAAAGRRFQRGMQWRQRAGGDDAHTEKPHGQHEILARQIIMQTPGVCQARTRFFQAFQGNVSPPAAMQLACEPSQHTMAVITQRVTRNATGFSRAIPTTILMTPNRLTASTVNVAIMRAFQELSSATSSPSRCSFSRTGASVSSTNRLNGLLQRTIRGSINRPLQGRSMHGKFAEPFELALGRIERQHLFMDEAGNGGVDRQAIISREVGDLIGP